ncbi:outer membrane protein OmpA-like peptidoglycan-associated protein [Flavobacterium sp. 7E]|uniref:OmpA family protein n=1 Tax=unclassified Flavobacterium TaxID=196869 RepID=UPI00157126F5|nr:MULTISPECIES: OmpA family protein [unclassified Flavobacterium]MBE0391077.1 putative lipoprotein YiaD [Flavobacterium sp. PL002]NRS89463.1 outer membrane protein OmpA-like peptidoglycan-associated protein [Flavobacterium sp. 7E]NRT15197.1 outer membrane protein OmpA-like peptidoglycan-associated protein [Flavobacterium sp. 28A]
MKKISILSMALVMAMGSLFTSCDAVKNTNNTQKGAGIGAVAGAVLGGVLGNNLGKGGNTAVGAVLGGVVGGVAGGVIGNKMDKQARQIDQAIPGAEVERVGEGIKLVLNENAVRFDTNKSSLTAAAKANLDKLIPVFQEYADTNITIFGYTDSSGPADFNLKLSGERAASVRDYLVSKGLVLGRFTVTGLGIADPIATNETSAGKAQNRRVEFAITANEKMQQDAQKESGN